jgi:hypothetical protein
MLTQTATLGLLPAIWLRIPPLLRSIFGPTAGKFLTVLLAALVLAGAGFAAAQSLGVPFSPPVATASPTVTQTATQTVEPTSTATAQPTGTITPSPSATATSTLTVTPTPTARATVTAVPTYQVLRGTVQADETLSCRYGPGADYLYQDGYINGLPMTITGRNDKGDWLYGLGLGYKEPCWVNARFIKLGGDIASLEPVYPDKVSLPIFFHPNFPPPKGVYAVRDKEQLDQVSVYWEGYELLPGDRESANSPIYLVEFWTCQGGEIVFTPIGRFVENAVITDEAGCSEPSHGRIFLAHRDGYVGPVEILPWPAHPTTTSTP